MEENNYIKEDRFLAKWLEGAISDNDLKVLVSKQDFVLYKKLRKGLNVLDDLDRPISDSFDKIQNRIYKKKNEFLNKQKLRWGISIAASILLIFGLYFTFNSNEISYKTSFAEQITFELPDGSEVVLNAKSEIIFNEKNWDSNRSVNLKGEAYFKVEKGNTFSVITSNGEINVLGTQFNVNSSDTYFEVVCYEGKVKVTNNNIDYLLNPGNSVRKINGNIIEENLTDNLYPSWTKGESSFVSVPLKYIILELEKQYNIEINANKIDNKRLFTGSFGHNNLKTALALVFKSMDIKCLEDEKGIFSLE
jgi:transmembrane sensor